MTGKILSADTDQLAIRDGGGAATQSSDREWWRQAAVYQIYPRSFADSNGDGLGDLKGIISRIPYLQRLGVDAVWLGPFYPSPLNDGGYDVADYRDVDPRIGTLEDFAELSTRLGAVGIRVIVDIVPNHSSSEHPWFQAALKAPKGSAERARYHFIDGKGPNGALPPSDWESSFGGPAWSPHPSGDGQWYLHLFDSTQPDLNWDNPEIVADFEKTVRFWADLGVSGFRVDVAAGCAKDLSPKMLALTWEEVKAMRTEMSMPGGKWHDCPINDRNETLEFYRGWRKIMNQYDPPLTGVAEAFISPERKRLYAAKDGLGQTFSFDLMFCNFDADEYRRVIQRQIEASKKYQTGSTWVLSTHDVVRHACRYGLPANPAETLQPFLRFYQKWTGSMGKAMHCDFALGLRRARAASLMMMGLPGSCYIYQGEELGLPQVTDIPDEQIQDPRFFRSNGLDRGRDGCRVPIPWTRASPNFGFSADPDARSHLPQPAWMGEFSVDAQKDDDASILNMYRAALDLRKSLQGTETMAWVDMGRDDVLAFDRPGGWRVIVNCSEDSVGLPDGKHLLSSAPVANGNLPPATTIWLQI